MTSILKNYHGFAKRRHHRRCQVTGLPIEPGDKFAETVYVEHGDFYGFKGLAIICDLVDEQWPDYDWMDYHAGDALWDWLLERLPESEAKACLDAAFEFWKTSKQQ